MTGTKKNRTQASLADENGANNGELNSKEVVKEQKLKKPSGKKVSREALALKNTAFAADYSGAPVKSASPVEATRGKQGKSAPPALEGALHSLQQQQRQSSGDGLGRESLKGPAKQAIKRSSDPAPDGVGLATDGSAPKKAKTVSNAERGDQHRPPASADAGGLARAADDPMPTNRQSLAMRDGVQELAAAHSGEHREGAPGSHAGAAPGPQTSGGNTVDPQATNKPAKVRKPKGQSSEPALQHDGAPGQPAGKTRKQTVANDAAAHHVPEAAAGQGGTGMQAAEPSGQSPNRGHVAAKPGRRSGGTSGERGVEGDRAGVSTHQAARRLQAEPGTQQAAPQPRDAEKAPVEKGAAAQDAAPAQAKRRRDEPGTTQMPDAAAAGAGTAAARDNSNRGGAGDGDGGFSATGQHPGGPALSPLAAARPLPPTGTTPVRGLEPIPMPRMDEVGRRQRRALTELQRQLEDVRHLYDELKATKIQDLEKALAEQIEYAEEQRRHLEHKARLWQAAAEAAEKKAAEAGSQQTTKRINELEGLVEDLHLEKAHLLRELTQKTREAAVAQQQIHDLRAQVHQLLEANVSLKLTQPSSGDRAQGAAEAAAGAPEASAGAPEAAADASDAAGAVQEASAVAEAAEEPAAAGDVEKQTPPAAEAAPAPSVATESDVQAAPPLARELAVQFPTPSPGIGVQFPTPTMQLHQMQALLGSVLAVPGSASRQTGLSSACQRVINMLPTLKTPSPSVDSGLVMTSAPQELPPAAELGTSSRRTPTGAAMPAPLSPTGSVKTGLRATPNMGGAPSSRPGVSTELKRIVGMLPLLRAPTPSATPHATTPAPSATTVVPEPSFAQPAITSTTPRGDASASLPSGSQSEGAKARSSSGSPIDGLCAAVQPNPGAHLTFSTDLSLAHAMGAPEAFKLVPSSQGHYSFVGFNPGSAKRPGVAPQGSPAAKSPTPQQVLREACSPPAKNASHSALGGVAAGSGPVHSGSVASNHLDAYASGLVARATVQQQEAQQQRMFSSNSAVGDLSSAQVKTPKGNAVRSPLPVAQRSGGRRHDADAGVAAALTQRSETEVVGAPGANRSPRAALPVALSPRSAEMAERERNMDWKIDITVEPLAYLFTHAPTGVAFRLKQVEVPQGQDMDAASGDGPQAAWQQEAWFSYTPVSIDNLADKLPEFLREQVDIPASMQDKLLEAFHDAALGKPVSFGDDE